MTDGLSNAIPKLTLITSKRTVYQQNLLHRQTRRHLIISVNRFSGDVISRPHFGSLKLAHDHLLEIYDIFYIAPQ